jgi:HSP20 family protein
MRREMDELFGDVWGEGWWPGRKASGFSPRVDVYYCNEGAPKAIVKVELPGVRLEAIALEISGRELVISGERPVQETEGRVYQQLEIEAGPFRRLVELNADVLAEQAEATYDEGILRVELPIAPRPDEARRVPISSSE